MAECFRTSRRLRHADKVEASLQSGRDRLVYYYQVVYILCHQVSPRVKCPSRPASLLGDDQVWSVLYWEISDV